VTRLRQRMLDELQRRNYSPNTVRSYMHAVEEFARYFRRSPDQLGPDHICEYQVHLFRDRKLSPRTIEGQTAALRFLFVKTLGRSYLPDQIPFPKCHKRLPTVLSQEEVTRLIDSAGSLMHRAMIMTLYATGVRRAELCRLKVCDIDSERMVLHIQQGKGGRDRDVPLSPKLLGILREYWRWMKPRTYLFPGMENNWRADVSHHREGRLDSRNRGGEAGRSHQASLAPYTAAQLRDPLAGGRCRSADDSDVAWTCEAR
jgi:integrase/recombinase XerD